MTKFVQVMDAKNVEHYLNLARATRIVQATDNTGACTVFFGRDESVRVAKSAKDLVDSVQD